MLYCLAIHVPRHLVKRDQQSCKILKLDSAQLDKATPIYFFFQPRSPRDLDLEEM